MSFELSASPIRIATRASRLAMWQAEHVAALLQTAVPTRPVDIVRLSTIGDRDKTQALTKLGDLEGGVGVFTREIQAAVLDGRADVAVHSLKDLPTEPAAGLILASVPERGPMFDTLVLPKGAGHGRRTAGGELQGSNSQSQTVVLPSAIRHLPSGARIGSGSPRRRAQLLHGRPDLQFVEARGNVETRLRKLDEGQFDALVLAEAGLIRLEVADRISASLRPPFVFPAVGQGALGIECRTDDAETRAALSKINDEATWLCVIAERTVLATLRAGCHAPLGVWARWEGRSLRLTAVVLNLDGTRRIVAEKTSAVATDEEAVALGRAVANELLLTGAAALLSLSGG